MLPEPSSTATVRPKGVFAVTLVGGVVATRGPLGGSDGGDVEVVVFPG